MRCPKCGEEVYTSWKTAISSKGPPRFPEITEHHWKFRHCEKCGWSAEPELIATSTRED